MMTQRGEQLNGSSLCMKIAENTGNAKPLVPDGLNKAFSDNQADAMFLCGKQTPEGLSKGTMIAMKGSKPLGMKRGGKAC